MIKPIVLVESSTLNGIMSFDVSGKSKLMNTIIHLIDEPLFMELSVEKLKFVLSLFVRRTSSLDDKEAYSKPEAQYVYDRKTDVGNVIFNETDTDMEELFGYACTISDCLSTYPVSEEIKNIDFTNEWILLKPNDYGLFSTLTYYGMSRPALACVAPDGGVIMSRPYPDEIEVMKRFSTMSEEEIKDEALSGDEYAIHSMINNSRGEPEAYLFWMEKLAETDDEDAMFELGLCYLEGITGESDYEQAASWLLNAAENGNEDAAAIAGYVSTLSEMAPPEESDDPEYWLYCSVILKKIGLWLNNQIEHYDEDICEEAAPYINKAFELVQRAADSGYPRGLWYLASYYDKGIGVEQSYEKEAEILNKGICLGSVECMNDLGSLYMEGDGVPKDPEKGISLIRQSAESGYPMAMFSMGRAYEYGDGIKQDINLAIEWYKKCNDADPDDELQERITKLEHSNN